MEPNASMNAASASTDDTGALNWQLVNHLLCYHGQHNNGKQLLIKFWTKQHVLFPCFSKYVSHAERLVCSCLARVGSGFNGYGRFHTVFKHWGHRTIRWCEGLACVIQKVQHAWICHLNINISQSFWLPKNILELSRNPAMCSTLLGPTVLEGDAWLTALWISLWLPDHNDLGSVLQEGAPMNTYKSKGRETGRRHLWVSDTPGNPATSWAETRKEHGESEDSSKTKQGQSAESLPCQPPLYVSHTQGEKPDASLRVGDRILLLGWEDGSVGKVLALQVWGPKSNLQSSGLNK